MLKMTGAPRVLQCRGSSPIRNRPPPPRTTLGPYAQRPRRRRFLMSEVPLYQHPRSHSVDCTCLVKSLTQRQLTFGSFQDTQRQLTFGSFQV